MNPNTPTKIAVHRTITASCSQWMSAARALPAGRRFHSIARATPEKAKPRIATAQVAKLRADLRDFIVQSPGFRKTPAPDMLEKAGKNAAQQYHRGTLPLKQERAKSTAETRTSATTSELHDRASVVAAPRGRLPGVAVHHFVADGKLASNALG